VLAVLVLLAVGAPGGSALAETAVSCTSPRGVPPAFLSTCVIEMSTDVTPGGTLDLSVSAPDSPVGYISVMNAGPVPGCTTPADSTLLNRPTPLVLTCPAGLPAGTSLPVAISTGQPYSFVAMLTVTYNAGVPSPVADAIALTSALPHVTVTYQRGWNLVGGPAGTEISGAVGPLYTEQAGDTGYEPVPATMSLQPGLGYWAYFASATSVSLPPAGTDDVTVTLPPHQWVMVGNPFLFAAALLSTSGANATVESYDPSSGRYSVLTPVPCCEIRPGEGAWVYSATGGPLRIFLGPVP
jgi:hypothetical protein